MANVRRIPARLHANLLLVIEEEAHRLRLFDVRSIAGWLGVAINSWRSWKAGKRMQTITAGRICERLHISVQSLQTRAYTAPAGSMIERAVNAARLATTPWYRWCAIVAFGKDLLIWLSRHRIDAGLSASIGGQPVRLSFQIGHKADDEKADYEISVEPTEDVWVVLQQRIGCTVIPLMEGNASAQLLTEIIRYVRFLTTSHARGTGRKQSN